MSSLVCQSVADHVLSVVLDHTKELDQLDTMHYFVKHEMVCSKESGREVRFVHLEHQACKLAMQLNKHVGCFEKVEHTGQDKSCHPPHKFNCNKFDHTASQKGDLNVAITQYNMCAGMGETWESVLKMPNIVYLVEEERKAFEKAKNE